MDPTTLADETNAKLTGVHVCNQQNESVAVRLNGIVKVEAEMKQGVR